MFYLSNRQGELIREHKNRSSLRRIRRSQPHADRLIITEGESFKKSLKEPKAVKVVSAKASKRSETKKLTRKERRALRKAEKAKESKKSKK